MHRGTPCQTFLSTLPRRQIKGSCAESFTEYWTCLDYSNLAELRHCRKQQKAFDSCVLDKLGWERPDLGDLSKVSPAKCGHSRVNGGNLIKAVCTPRLRISGKKRCFFGLCTLPLNRVVFNPALHFLDLNLLLTPTI